jgi:MFS family permease
MLTSRDGLQAIVRAQLAEYGAITVTLGLGLGFGSLICCFSLSEHGWGSVYTIGFLDIAAVAPIFTNLLSVIGRCPLTIGGPFIVAAGLGYLTFITADGDYLALVMPGLVIMGIGMSFVFVPLQNLALAGVAPHDAGAASAVANSAMQIGGSIGLSVFTAIYASVVVGSNAPQLEGFANGYSATFLAAAVGMVIASIVAAALIRGTKNELLPPDAAATVHMG